MRFPWAIPVVVIVAVLGMRALPAASAQETPQVAVSQVQATDYPELSAIVTVRDGSGVPISGLPPTAFTASEGGVAVPVSGVEQVEDASLPLSVVMVIDVSGSMEGEPLAAAKRAAAAFVGQLGAEDEAALFAFSAQVNEVLPFTQDKAALTNAINGLAAEGNTSLYEAVQTAVFAAGGAGAERRAIVILSDGENESDSPVTAEQSLQAAGAAGVPVFAIGFGAGADTSYLEGVAAGTQGQFFAAGVGDVTGVYAAIGALLRSQYVVRMRAEHAADGAESALTVSVTVDGQTLTSAPVTFTRGTAPPTAAATATAVPPPPETDDDDGGASPMVFGLAGLAGIAAIGGGGAFAVRRMRAARAQREREAHAGRLSDEALPPPIPGAPMKHAADVLGRIVVVTGEQAGTTFEVGATPIVLGSHPEADVQVARGAEVAPRHAQLWVRDGKIMLRHTGGGTRPTYVGGRAVDWVILDGGDEFTIGGQRYRAEIAQGDQDPAS